MTKWPTKWVCVPQRQISLGIRTVWSESSLCAQWIAQDPSFLHADSEDSDQTGRMPRLIWVFAGRTLILLVLSCRGSYYYDEFSIFVIESPIHLFWSFLYFCHHYIFVLQLMSHIYWHKCRFIRFCKKKKKMILFALNEGQKRRKTKKKTIFNTKTAY